MPDSKRVPTPVLAGFLIASVPVPPSWASDPQSIEVWRTAHFSDPDGLATGNDHADPDGDGLLNLVEYALGLDPKKPDPITKLPRLEAAGDELRYHYRRFRDDVTCQVQKSPDLDTWSAEGVDQGSGALGETFASIPMDGTERAFVRLLVKGSGGFAPLYHASTKLEPALTVEKEGALHTYFSDRARDRHAREDQFQAYDHYLSFYWEGRTAAVEIVDTVPKGGTTITFNVESQWKLKKQEAELRFFYRGINTVAEYHNNGIMTQLTDTTYTRSVSHNAKEGRPLQVGDRLEFELSQFLENPPQGRENYYGTTYLYIVGKGLVPWEARGFSGIPPPNGRTAIRFPKRAGWEEKPRCPTPTRARPMAISCRWQPTCLP